MSSARIAVLAHETIRFLHPILGLKASLVASVAVSIGGVVSLSVVALAAIGALMKNSVKKSLSGWCGVALLWRPGGYAPPYRESALKSR